MTIPESVMVAAFCLGGVFLVLIALCFVIKLFSFSLVSVEKKRVTEREAVTLSQPVSAPTPTTEAVQTSPVAEQDFSAGVLTLREVDEPTAAMIMAIVSDESGIPLSQLCFKSIRRIRQG